MRNIWANLYCHKAPLFTKMHRNPKQCRFGGIYEMVEERIARYQKLPHMTFLDVRMLVIRLNMITTAIFTEANKRAKEDKKMACVVVDKNSEDLIKYQNHFLALINFLISYLPEIGLSKYPELYETIFLRNLSHELFSQYRRLNNIACLHLIGFKETRSLKNGIKMHLIDVVFGNEHPNEGIEIKYSPRAEWRMEDIPEEYLIVDTYRLDQNALPGNELWLGKVAKDHSHPSFDIRHTAVPFIHNPLINKSWLCGRNLHAYDRYWGVKHWKDMYSVMDQDSAKVLN